MYKEDRKIGFGWSKDVRLRYNAKFDAELVIDYFNSNLVRTIFMYIENGEVLYTIENISIRQMCFLVKASLKEGKNLLKEALEELKKRKEFSKKQAKEKIALELASRY